MLKLSANLPRFDLSEAENDAEEALLEAMRAAARSFIERAALMPEVSGQARGTMIELATDLGVSLPPAIPALTERVKPGQDQQSGAAATTYEITPYSFFWATTIPYILRWQTIWGQPLTIGELDFQRTFQEETDIPITFIDLVSING